MIKTLKFIGKCIWFPMVILTPVVLLTILVKTFGLIVIVAGMGLSFLILLGAMGYDMWEEGF